MSYQFADLNGTKIHYELRGEGTAVTFIHAGINNLNMWDDQMKAFTAVHQVLRYDVRGWGQTARPNVNFSNHEDLKALLQHLGIEKTAIVGCSWGGKIALDFALTYPEMVTALVLVGTGLGGYEWTFASFREQMEAMKVAYGQGNKEWAAELQTQVWVDGPGREAKQLNPAIRQRAYDMVLHTLELPEGEGEWQELEPPAIDRLAEIQTPTYIIRGEFDVPDIQGIAELLEEKLPNVAEHTMMLNTAHLPNMERPSKFNDIVLAFLDKVSWQATVYAILPHRDEAKVWLEEGEDGFALPHITMSGGKWDTTEALVQQPLRDALDPNIRVLYRASLQQNDEAKTTESIFVLDNLGASVANGRWIDAETLDNISLANPSHQELIQTCLQEWATGEIPALRPEWARPGWYAQAENWIQDTLAKQGHPVKSLENVRNWCLSYVLRAHTNDGEYYFKTVGKMPLFVNEAVTVNKLAAIFPHHVLTPVAIDAERDWMILPPLKQMLGWGAPIEHRKGFLRQYAQLQQTAVSHIDSLIAIGVHDRRLQWMQTQIQSLIEAEFCHETIEADEVTQLIDLIPRLQAICAELITFPIPQSIVHGDLHGGNVGIQDEQYIFFDWTDACISHPFFDMLDIFYEKDTAVQTELRDAYLAMWTDYAPMSQLLDIWQLAEIGAAIHHSFSYWQLLIHIEPHVRSDLSHMLPIWLRKILTSSKNL